MTTHHLHNTGQSRPYLTFIAALASLLIASVCRAEDLSRLYTINTIEIRRYTLAGSEGSTLVPSGFSNPLDIALDLVGQKMFWTDTGDGPSAGAIRSADLDGSNVTSIVSGLSFPTGLAIDSVNQKVYWANGTGGTVQRADLNGLNIETIASGLSFPTGVALDTTNGKVYWTEMTGGRVMRANLNGTSVETVISSGITSPYHIALDVPSNRIYITDAGTSTGLGRVLTASLNGTDLTELATALFSPQDIAIDTVAGRAYWTDGGSLKRSNLTWSTTETIFTYSDLRYITLYLDSDGDGVANELDGCPVSSNKTSAGQCGCDGQETDSDNDGTADCVDGCDNDASKTIPGVCGCGIADTDSDSDGVVNCIDSCDNDPLKSEPETCGCGVPDSDSDSDGTPDCNDSCSTNPGKALPGLCGCGTPDIDVNNNGTVDCTEVGLKLPQPRIRVIDGRVMVQLPKKAGVRFDYTYTFLNRTKLLISGSRRAKSAATLSFKVPRNATAFSLQYVAKGPLYRDYTSPKYKRTIK